VSDADLTARLRAAWARYKAVEDMSDEPLYDADTDEEIPTEKDEARRELQDITAEMRAAQSKPVPPRGRNLGRHGRSRRKHLPLQDGYLATDAWGRPIGVRWQGEIITRGYCVVHIEGEDSDVLRFG
jgi:hypothetical protein